MECNVFLFFFFLNHSLSIYKTLFIKKKYPSFLFSFFFFVKMKFILLLFYIFNVASCIQYGTDVLEINQYPFYIMIGNPHICGGTLLSYDPPFVLTAAHCVADAGLQPSNFSKQENPYFVNYYNAHRDKQKSISILDWTIHPKYNVSGTVNLNYDVAIVQLATSLKRSSKVKRVPLWSSTMISSIPVRGKYKICHFFFFFGSRCYIKKKLKYFL